MTHWLRPGLLGLHAFAVLAVGFCVVMGLWQLGAYEGRQGDAEDNAARRILPLQEVWKPGEPFTKDLEHQRVTVEGRFADEDLTASRPDGSSWVVTPFEVGDAALLVVRGEGERAPASDATELEVVLAPSEPAGTGAISIPVLLNELPHRLYGGYGISRTDTGLPLVTPPTPDVSWTVGLRNLAYSLQWWVFGAFALYMWWRMASENVAMRRAAEEAEEDFDAPVA